MSNEQRPVTVVILDKEYLVACGEKERDALHASVDFLNGKMRELRDGGKIIGTERIAVMAALNIAHEFLQYKQQNDNFAGDVNLMIRRLQDKISGALNVRQRVEA